MNLVGSPIDLLIAFTAGVLMSFTPCVYPLIPITVGYIGASARGSRLKGFILSAIYALGIATTYSILGAIASLTGKVFGQIAGSPWPYFIVANACIFFGLVLLGVFNLSLPTLTPLEKATDEVGGGIPFKADGDSMLPSAQIVNPVRKLISNGVRELCSLTGLTAKKIEPKGIISVFLLGLVSGLVVGPCTAPALATILVYVGTKQNLFYGMALLFCFAYGLCTVLILAGTFSSILVNLPKSGIWIERIKKICGIILILVGEYFLIIAGRYFL